MKHKVLLFFLWLSIFLWLTFCFYLSWQPSDSTTQLSQTIAHFLLELLGHLGLSPAPQKFHESLRLFAHFGVFFVTGFLLACAIAATFPQSNKIVLFSVSAVLCTIIAVLSEVGKLNVPGRHLTWSEVGLNVLGAVCGIVCMTGIRALLRHLR